MAGSAIQGKADIKQWVDAQMDIRVIVDVGCGSGTYAKLLGGGYIFIGIEIWAPYVKEFNLTKLYQKIIIGDIRHVIMPAGDLVIFGDVLEHMPKLDALQVINRAQENYKHMVISIPIDGRPSREQYNPYEVHMAEWTFGEVRRLVDWVKVIDSKGMGIFIK